MNYFEIYNSEALKLKMTDANEVTAATLKEIVEGLKTQDQMQRLKTSESLVK